MNNQAVQSVGEAESTALPRSSASSPPLKIPAAIIRLLERQPRMKGDSALDFFNLFDAIASAVEPETIIEYLHVVDVTEATFEIQFLKAMKVNVIERKREERREKRGKVAVRDVGYDPILKALELAINDGKPVPNEPKNPGTPAEAESNKVEELLNSPTDDAQAFLDSLPDLHNIERLLQYAEERRQKALQGIENGNRKLQDKLRTVSGTIIEATAMPSPNLLGRADDVTPQD